MSIEEYIVGIELDLSRIADGVERLAQSADEIAAALTTMANKDKYEMPAGADA